MKRTFFVLLLLAAGTALRAQTLGGEYRLSRVFPVEGRQGIAADSNYYYVSGSTVLYKYDKQGRLVAVTGSRSKGCRSPRTISAISTYGTVRFMPALRLSTTARVRISRSPCTMPAT